jgi:hypothetical protein
MMVLEIRTAAQDDMNTNALLLECLHWQDSSLSQSSTNFNKTNITAMMNVSITW